jgi:phage terminase large subunit
MRSTAIFKHNYSATAHVVVNQGGTSSGKTYSILQVLFALGRCRNIGDNRSGARYPKPEGGCPARCGENIQNLGCIGAQHKEL